MRPPLQVLIFDRDSSDIRILARSFSDFAVIPHYTSNFSEAKELLQTEKLHGAIISMDTQATDGEELVKIAQHSASNQTIPLALMTESPYIAAIQNAYRLGFELYINKPMNMMSADNAFLALTTRMNQERRRYQRAHIHSPVQITWKNHTADASIKNISSTGLLTDAPKKLPLGQPIAIHLPLQWSHQLIQKQSQPLHAVGVRYAANGDLGLRFTGLNEPQRAHLESWIDATLNI